jgi:hypothetical protein
MKYQVLGHRRRLQKGDKPYDVICEFDNLEQLYYMMDKVNRNIYNEVLVIDTYTNELVASRELEKPLAKKKRRG